MKLQSKMRERRHLFHVVSLLRSPFVRVARALSSTKPRKSSQTKRGPYLALSIIMEIQYILLLTEILINAGFIKWRQSVSIINRRRNEMQLRQWSKTRTLKMQNIISHFSVRKVGPALQTYQTSVLRTAWRCISGWFFLLHFTHFADEVGSSSPLRISD